MDMFDVLFAKAVSGGGGAAPTLIAKNITANGSYVASDDDADGYSAVSVDVANTYTAQDEGKVVSGGQLVAQTSATYTENATYDTTLVNSVTVNVPDLHWQLFREQVRTGKAPSIYPVGTLLYDKWGDNSSTAFRIVSYDQYFDADLTAQGYTHSVTLLEEYLDENVVFDAPEAFLYLSQDLPAGTYYVQRSSTYYGFTTTATVPSGGQLCFKVLPSGGSASTSTVQGYASKTATTPLFEVSTSNSSSGTNLGTFDYNTTTNVTYGTLNSYNRAMYGNDNYYESGIRQLLNATTADNWWTPKTIFDRPTNTSMQGKLYRLNSDFVNVLAAPNMTSIANTVGETAALDGKTFTTGTTYTFKDKLFLVAPKEVNLSYDLSVGSLMSYYSGASDTQRKKYQKSTTPTVYSWWLRTPFPSNSYSVRRIYQSGIFSDEGAAANMGSAAACVIQ